MHLTVDIQLPGEGAAGRELAGQMLIVRMVETREHPCLGATQSASCIASYRFEGGFEASAREPSRFRTYADGSTSKLLALVHFMPSSKPSAQAE